MPKNNYQWSYQLIDAIKELSEKEARKHIQATLGDTSKLRELVRCVFQLKDILSLPVYARQIFDIVMADPVTVQSLTNYPFQLVNIAQDIPACYARELIMKASPASLAETLKRLITDNPAIIPVFLEMGVKPALMDDNGKCMIETLMAKPDFSEKDIDPALAMIQYGDYPEAKNAKGQNILQIIHETYPLLSQYLARHAIPADKSGDPVYVFSRVNIASLRIEMRYLSDAHKARSEYLSLLYMLSNDRENPASDSLLRHLPLEIVMHIVSFFNINAMRKSAKEADALACFIMRNPDEVKKLSASPGGINVFQREKSKPSFCFFKSATLLSREYANQKLAIQKRLANNPSAQDKKQWLDHSLFRLDMMRNEHALTAVRSQAELGEKYVDKKMLAETVQDTDLYYPIAQKILF